ncbi:MAG: prolyl oligopeptidase family serine peptidase [Planctomycetota bacterium]|nr:prolyl oligopeptidase family serine peptidase [Planctomycetota bacterium]
MRNKSLLIVAIALLTTEQLVFAQAIQTQQRANFKLGEKYSSAYLRTFTYSTSVQPSWINKTDRFHYSFRTSAGTRYWLVDPAAKTKTPLFDHNLVSAAVTEASQKAVEPTNLKLSSIKFEEDGKTFNFVSSGWRFTYDRSQDTVKKRRKARKTWRERAGASQSGSTSRSRGRGRSRRSSFGRGSTSSSMTKASADGKYYAPDKTGYVYAKGHNLYFVPGEKVTAKDKSIVKASTQTPKTAAQPATETKPSSPTTPKSKPAPEFVYDTKKTLQLSQDGAEDFSFGTTTTTEKKTDTDKTKTDTNKTKTDTDKTKTDTGKTKTDTDKTKTDTGKTKTDTDKTKTDTTRREEDNRSRDRSSSRSRSRGPSLSWSKNSKAFYASRRDSRGIKDLFLINSIADPRPSLQTYQYSMPGEESIRTTELHYFHRDTDKLTKVEPKWIDESYREIRWVKETDQMQFMRRDRLLRNVEFCSLDTKTGKTQVLFSEGSKDGYLKVQSMRQLEKRKQFIWWSERTGWGHFYLYDANGKLLNAITKGSFRASSIVSVDEENAKLYFRGNGREKGNIYHEHTYRVNLDGSGLTLLDPGTATYRSSLSESKNYVVANGSRIDQAPTAVLNDANGRLIMELEKMDTSKLLEAGWKMPETFSVKAADGVTNLYGNMWKPFNFDAKKRYPIILHVYPGPQQEGVSHSFSAASSRQQLAQLGFIVVQVGHRGGTPTRSRAYANYGYYNLRDYGLADKKTAVEQLAQRHSFIDVERVGMYGHSGGGFMTAAALLQKPYNDFFKVGVSSAGNHDNNIYNHSWSEKYHGLKEVTADSKSSTSGTTQGSTRDTGTQSGQRGRRSGGDTSNRGESSRSNAARTTSSTSNDDKTDKKKLEIHVPTNAELAANLKGKLLLVHGEIDNNVHPANTMRLVDALIKANKRFDLLIIPGARHGFGSASTYFRHRMWEYFATHLIGDFRTGADILDK